LKADIQGNATYVLIFTFVPSCALYHSRSVQLNRPHTAQQCLFRIIHLVQWLLNLWVTEAIIVRHRKSTQQSRVTFLEGITFTFNTTKRALATR